MTTLKNEFSWSVSRDDLFKKCRRMYYFQYYGSWGGWEREADDKTRMIYILKHLQSRQMWAGSKVHECIENTLTEIKTSIKRINIEQKIETTLDLMRKEFLSSKNKKYLTNPKTCALFEHEYGLDVSEKEWRSNADNVAECLKQFFNSDVFKEISQLLDNQWLKLEQFPFFYLEDTKIYAALDFAFREDDGLIIYDWKTGNENPEKDKFQLACYGLFAVQKWNVEPKNVKLIDFFLSTGKQNEFQLRNLNLDQIENCILTSIDKMENLLEDPIENTAKEEDFSLTNNKKICNYCNYKKMCCRS